MNGNSPAEFGVSNMLACKSANGEQGKGKKRAVGWFPASYVKLLESRKEDDAGASTGQAVASGGERYVALFPYTGQYEDELSFEEGATILVTGKDEEAWWKG